MRESTILYWAARSHGRPMCEGPGFAPFTRCIGYLPAIVERVGDICAPCVKRGEEPHLREYRYAEEIAYWTAHYEAREMNERAEEYLDYREDYEDHQF